MDQTTPRLYPYPQCEPPLIKDGADATQVANLALTIDADVQNLFNTADNNLLTPDGCHLAAPLQTINQYDPITFTVGRFDNTPGSVMSESGGIRVRQDGTYLVTGWAQVDQGPTPPLTNLKMVISVEGTTGVATEGLGINFNITTLPGQINGSVLFRLNAGRLIQVSVVTSGTATLTLEGCEFSAVRLGPL